MPGEPKRMTSPAEARELAALIAKRLAQGLPKTLIAARLGVSYKTLVHHIERGEKLAKETA